MKNNRILIWALGICLFFTYQAKAETFTIFVAERQKPAYTAAQQKAVSKEIMVEYSLQKALNRAVKLLSGKNIVKINVASGEFHGNMGAGIWNIPAVLAPEARLHILGGWNGDFSQRTPFVTLSRLVTRAGRSSAVLSVGKKSQLAELVVSGLVMDAKPSNNYDGGMNLLKAGTTTYRMISFGYLATNKLVIADNIFANAPQVVLEPYISPLSDKAEVQISNNFFINNVIPIQELSGVPVGRRILNKIKLNHNSFVLNWPYNPDPTSSNVGAIGLYHKGGVQNVHIENNLFAFNVGGAFQHDWPVNRMPNMLLKKNLFFKNATLFGKQGEGDGAIVGKFGPNARYLILDVDGLEDNFEYAIAENVAMSPNINLEQSLQVDVDKDDPYGDHLIEGYAPPVEIEAGTLPFATGDAGYYGVSPSQCWAN